MATKEADDNPPPKLKEAKGQEQEMGISEGALESLNATLAEKEAELERVKKSRPKGGIPKFVAVDLAEKELARAKRALVKAQGSTPDAKVEERDTASAGRKVVTSVLGDKAAPEASANGCA